MRLIAYVPVPSCNPSDESIALARNASQLYHPRQDRRCAWRCEERLYFTIPELEAFVLQMGVGAMPTLGPSHPTSNLVVVIIMA